MMTTTITTTVTGAGMNIIGTGMPTTIIAINGITTTVQLVAFQQVNLSSSSQCYQEDEKWGHEARASAKATSCRQDRNCNTQEPEIAGTTASVGWQAPRTALVCGFI